MTFGQIPVAGSGVSAAPVGFGTPLGGPPGTNIYTFPTLPPGGAPGNTEFTSDLGLCVWNGSSWNAVGGGGGGGGGSITPAALTSSGINTAAAVLSALGGGVVNLPPVTINLAGQSSLLAFPGIIYRGSGWVVNSSNILVGGTIISGDGTFPIFAGNPTDLAGPFATSSALNAGLISGTGVQNLGISNGSYGLKFGALFQAGAGPGSNFSNLFIQNCTQWGMWMENFSGVTWDNIIANANANNIGWFASGTLLYNYGNSRASKIVSNYANQASSAGRGQFTVVQARYGSQINDFIMRDVGGSGNPITSTQAATMTSALASTIDGVTANILVGNSSGVLSFGSAVVFSATTGSGTGTSVVAGTQYFVVGSSATAIQVAGLYNPHAIFTNGSATIGIPLSSGASLGLTVGTQVQFTQTIGTGAGQILANTPYYVTTLNQQSIQVSATSGGTPITLNAGGTSAVFGSFSTTSPYVIPNASGTPTIKSSSIGVTNLAYFPVGSPVSFTTTANGFTANNIYSVFTASGNTGAGFITLINRKDVANQVVATGSTAQNIITQGFPNFEVGAQDQGSIVTYSGVDGPCDLEQGGTCNIYIGAVAGFEAHFGICAGTGVTQSIAMRNAQKVTIFALQNMSIDADVSYLFAGPQVAPTNQGPTGMISLLNNKGAIGLSNGLNIDGDFFYNNTINQLQLTQCLAPLFSQQGSGNTISQSQGNLISLVTAGGGTQTLPNLSSTAFVGWTLFISNPTANPYTFSMSQNVIGLGSNIAAASGFTLAAYSSAILISQNNAGTMYWARYA